jgi:DnaJ family protein C protein 3
MILRFTTLALLAPFALALSPRDIPSDTPVSSLISSAKASLSNGNSNEALTYFDVAIQRDPSNYLTIFQRGATYLSLGRNSKASQDFDAVLAIKPDFEGALMQRAKIKAKSADWAGARKDYETAKRKKGPEIEGLEEAQGAAVLAAEAEKKGDWEACVSQAGVAIMTASAALGLRQMRARCRFERGEVQEGVYDLAHVLQISPGLVDPHMQIASMLFYSVGDLEKGIAQTRKCLHSDPDSKSCQKLFRRQKKVDKAYGQIKQNMDMRMFNSAVKILVGSGDATGLIQDVKEDVQAAKEAGSIHQNSPNALYTTLVEITCEAYREVCPSSLQFSNKLTRSR